MPFAGRLTLMHAPTPIGNRMIHAIARSYAIDGNLRRKSPSQTKGSDHNRTPSGGSTLKRSQSKIVTTVIRAAKNHEIIHYYIILFHVDFVTFIL
jgi:hypothetical protein